MRILDTSQKIIGINVVKNEIDAKLKFDSTNMVAVDFLKWKPDENLVLTIYLNQTKGDRILPNTLSFNERELLGTTLSFQSLTQDFFVRSPVNTARKYFPDWLLTILIAFGVGFSVFLSSIPFTFIVRQILVRIRYYRWRKKHYPEFYNFIHGQSDLSDYQKVNFVSKLTRVNDEVWARFYAKKPEFPLNIYISIFFSLIMIAISLSGILSLILYKELFFS